MTFLLFSALRSLTEALPPFLYLAYHTYHVTWRLPPASMPSESGLRNIAAEKKAGKS
jgi:hypothetical protein